MTAAEAALRYASRGWHVLPLWWPVETGEQNEYGRPRWRCACPRGAKCGSAAKHPLTQHGLRDAAVEPDAIRAWWDRWSAANVGIATGARSGLIVLDVDHGHGGGEALLAYVDRRGPIIDCVGYVITGSGGDHYYFAHPGGKVANAASVLGPGLDIRGDGGYVVAPPSRHVVGYPYEWCQTWWAGNPLAAKVT